MHHNDKVEAIKYIRPNAEFTLKGDELIWMDQIQTEPTNTEIEKGLKDYLAKMESDKLAAIAKKEAAALKLAALGLDLDDLKALGLG